MPEVASWTSLIRWLATLGRYLPDRVLRWAWSKEKVLGVIEAFHFDQAPRFHVRAERLSGELSSIGFNVFNFSPFKLAFVGADLRIALDGMELGEYKTRFPSEISALPYARSGFWFKHTLTDSQIVHLRSYPNNWTLIRINGALIIRSIFGEHRKDIAADVVAVIDR
jgi:hypothetical protein